MYRKTAEGWLKHLDFIVIDVLCLYISYLLAYWLRHFYSNPFASSLYMTTSLIMVLLVFTISIVFQTHKDVLRRGMYAEFVSIVKQSILVIFSVTFYLFMVVNDASYSRMTMLFTGVYYVAICFIARCCWKNYLQNRKVTKERAEKSLIILTTKDLLERVEGNIQNNNYMGYFLAGIVVIDEDMVGETIEDIPIVANGDTVIEYICREWVDEIFLNISSTNVEGEKWIHTFAEMGITVHLRLMHASELQKNSQFVERLGRYTVLTTTIGTVNMREAIVKRVMDILSGIVGCIITVVLMIFLGPIIYIKSPGPIFFKQVRIGKNGHKFQIYKFRSMYMDAEERKKELMEQNKMSDGMMFKVDWDTRIIGSEKGPDKGIGNFMRKYSLDEWPQFFNVLKGDMSLIGTRPPTVDEWEKYQAHHRARLAAKPGLTGMWQVSGRSKITDFEEVVKLDMEYITKWSLGLDIKILLKTIWVVLRRDGAM